MRILLTNDDGVYAPGIRALLRVLSEKHEVFTLAPEREMSATGHAITLHKPLRVKEVEVEGVRANLANGTPSDCVKLGVEAVMPSPPDLIISGINFGPNLGNDVFYSGTVSAAVEGHFLGFPAIAASLVVKEGFSDFSPAARYIDALLSEHGEKIASGKYLLNLNFPPLREQDIKGTKVTTLSHRNYSNVFDRRVDPRGEVYYWMTGRVEEKEEEGTDTHALAKNFVSITPLTIDLTHHQQIKELKKIF